ncbi:class III extradiol dioxygenase subunit B-like domain-containing protein [Curtanaerobium respiraculi]|uniref:class III extradiol dioxygenase subunit B-like domain-containing protein n=1 Tax=Curtanaerobium respiraculi TaxID=2949669 RepID=UPI0024B3A207|nr:class III extradiol dioxygenase subunit B-like domain-containing protein [Curtanaerobium respiraculi]
MPILAAYAVPHPPLIIPGVGRGEERCISATISSYEEVARRIAAHAPDTIIVSSPHAPAYRDAFALVDGDRLRGDMKRFRDREDALDCAVDVEFCAAAEARARAAGIPLMRRAWRGEPMDHAAFVPLYFVNQAYADYRLVEVGLSGLPARDHFELGKALAGTADALGRRVVFIASGDWSHKLKEDGPYGFVPEGPELDRQLCAAFRSNDLDALFNLDGRIVRRAAECGLRSFQIMAGALDGLRHTGELLSYEGPFGVGYGVAAFEVE